MAEVSIVEEQLLVVESIEVEEALQEAILSIEAQVLVQVTHTTKETITTHSAITPLHQALVDIQVDIQVEETSPVVATAAVRVADRMV